MFSRRNLFLSRWANLVLRKSAVTPNSSTLSLLWGCREEDVRAIRSKVHQGSYSDDSRCKEWYVLQREETRILPTEIPNTSDLYISVNEKILLCQRRSYGLDIIPSTPQCKSDSQIFSRAYQKIPNLSGNNPASPYSQQFAQVVAVECEQHLEL